MLSHRLTYWKSVQIFIIFLDLFKQTIPLRYSESELDETLNIKRDRNQTIIIIGYVAGTEYPPDIEIRNYKRHGRHISGALTYAVNKINSWAQNNSKESLLPSTYQISVHFVETYGEMNNSIQAVAKMSVEKKVWAIIGPQETCRTEADIAMAFNILMISHFCTDNILTEDSQRYSTFVRTRPQVSGLANYLVSFLKRFKWNAVSIISSDDKENEFILQNCLSVLKAHNITILHNKLVMSPAIYGSANNKFNKIVENTFQSTRIYVFIGSDFEIFGLLMALYEKGLTDTGNYFVVSLVLRLEAISDSAFGNIQVDSRSLRNFVIISHIEPEGQLIKTESSKFKYFMSRPPFNVESQDKSNTSYAPMESSYLYDAVLLYATVVGIILKNPSLGSPKDGILLKKLLLNRYYKSVFGYMNHIDNKGEAYGNYTVNQLIINANGEMKIDPIGLFKLDDGSVLEFEFKNNKNINWVHDIPRDIPECGFNGEICRTNEKFISIPVSLFILLILVIFVSAFVIKSKRYEKELERLLWKIDRLKEIDFSNHELLEKFSFITRPPIKEIENGNVCLPFEEDSQFLLAKSCCNIGHILQPDWGTSNLILCMYKNQEVVVKRVYFSLAISITRKVKKELKTLREISYVNLNKFMGAIIEHQDTWVVWEFCDRGSLQDVLYSTKLTKEYPVFLSSFAFDVIRGLIFLHENPDICFHGHLKSSNCLVDSRWTVKLTDFGMREFLTYVSPQPDTPEYIYFLSLFWTAPEILRDMIQHKSHNNQFLQSLKLGLIQERKRSHENKTDVNASNFSNDESCLEAFIKIKFPPNPNSLDSISFQKSDIYSFGMIFYELHSCQIPFLSNYSSQNSPKEIIRRLIVLNDQFKVPYRPKLSLLSRTDKKQIDLIKLCWQENATQRPTAKVIYNRFKVLFGEKKNLVECMKEKMILYTKNLEKEVMKRTEELREEKKQNEELLYQMLPIPVAEQLRQHKQVEAEAFDSVSIYFSDIVGFTELAGFCSPFEVINLLNQLYTSFDKIIDNFNVYKVETIGDSYMVVSGLPTQFDEHAREMANMSLRLLEEITKGFVIPSEKYKNERLKLRIGLHSGPCCAGVVGTRNPRYCLFGDTVNMASRMESNGEALKIHCSEAFILQILYLNEFHIVERGVIEVKGKGSVNTFWLIGKLEQNISNIDSIKFVHSPSYKSNSEISSDGLMLEKSFKGKSKNNFFEKMKENTYKTKFQKRDLIK